MEKIKTNYSRRSFLKSSLLAGGGLMISFNLLSEFRFGGKTNGDSLPDQWNELNGYVRITPDNDIKNYLPQPGIRAKCDDLTPHDRGRRTGCGLA